MFYRRMPPNIQLNWIKHYMEQNRSSSFKETKCWITGMNVDYSSSNLIFVTGSQEIKIAVLVEFGLLFRYFVFLVGIFAFITFGDFFFLFQDNKANLKQVLGYNHENRIISWCTVPLRGRLHCEFQPGLKFCCDYKTNYSLG